MMGGPDVRYHNPQARKQTMPSPGKDNPDSNLCGKCSRFKIASCTTLALVVLVVVVVVTIAVVLHTKMPDAVPNTSTPAKRVAAFNIQTFGKSKMANATIAQCIVEILDRYDIVLVQEVRDMSQQSLKRLLKLLNKFTSGSPWEYIASGRLGRTNYKEQYVFFYKQNSIKVLQSFQYDDSKDDVFEREPFSVLVGYTSPITKAAKRVVLLALHTKPRDTHRELMNLPAVIEDTERRFPSASSIIAMGDFNADCQYLRDGKKKTLEIFHNESRFTQHILDSEDTTVGKTDCAYDRVFVYGSQIVVKNATVYKFDQSLDSRRCPPLDISDHWPVEFLLD